MSSAEQDNPASRCGEAGAADGHRKWYVPMLPVVFIAACAELGIGILNNSAFPVYLALGLHIASSAMGAIMAFFFVSEALFKAPLGVLSDKLGRKPLMIFGAMITVFTPLLVINIRYHAAAPTAVAVLISLGFLRLLDGLGQSSLWPSLFAYVGDVVVEKKRASAMGLLNSVYMACLAFGFLAGGYVDDTFGPVFTHDAGIRQQLHAAARDTVGMIKRTGRQMMDHLHHHAVQVAAAVSSGPPPVAPIYKAPHYYPSFFLAAILFGLATIVAVIGLRGKAPAHAESVHADETEISWAGFMKAVRMVPQYVALAFITFLGIGFIIFVVKLFVMTQYHKTELEVGQLILWPALFIAAISQRVGHLADVWGKANAIRLGYVLCTIGLWGVPVLHHFHYVREAAFMVSCGILGIGFTMAFPAWLATVTSLSDHSKRGAIFGAVSAAQGVGVLVGSQAGSWLYGYRPIAPFVGAAVLVTLATVLAFVFVREKPLPAASAEPAAAPQSSAHAESSFLNEK